MNKLIAALVAVLVTGVAGFTVAQEAPRPAQPKLKIVETEGEGFDAVLLKEDDVYVQRPAQTELRYLAMQHGQPGTWQIVNVNNLALLLNTATGETFSLDKGEDGLRWKPIHRPMPDMPAMPRTAEPRKRDMPDMKSVEERLEALRKELRNTKGEAREKLEKAIEELERNRERKDAEPERDRERKDVEPERKRDQDNTENQLREIEETIETLRKRFDESDSVKEREKIERTIKELKEKAENLRKERKKDR